MEVVVKNQNKTHQQHGNQVNIPESTLSVRSNGNSADAGGGGNVADGARSPFQREVREWQRIDPNTGALLTGRLEADRWINGPQNSYGKISDSQNISQPDGTQHTQRKQLEVLQARTSRGAMQVIRTQTVQKTSSRWSSSKSASACASASASATSSPILTKAHNALPSISSSHHSTNSVHHSHFHKPFQLADPWPPTLNICEVDHIDDDDVTVSTDAHAVVEHADESDIDDSAIDQHYYLQNKDSDSSGSKSHSSHLFKHHSLNIYNNTHNGTNSNHSLLLDTAPSIKLSNLMKSSSSISSNNSSSNITPVKTIRSASTTTNSYKSASKISLHAIVGNNSGTSTDIKASNIRKLPTALSVAPIIPASSTTGIPPARTTPWQQLQPEKRTVNRLLEQPAFYGNSSNSSNDSSTKSQSPSPRVGGNEDDEYIVVATRVTDHGEVIPRTNTFGTNSFVNTPHRQIGGSIKSRANVRLTPTQPNRQQQQRQDLESFRYGKIANNDNVHDDDIEYDDDDDEDEDEDLRTLTTRNQRHQLNPVRQSITTTLHRSRSISTDDLSTEWDANDDTTEASGEWRRVSKLRRSFQSTSKSGTSGPRHPLDLPPFSVNVSKIRAEIENGRRLNTAMRNNHVDLAALNTILNKSSELKPIPAKRTTFLTAESLKEIRGKLKKLSDESLYKDDFIVHKHPAEINEQIKVQEVKDISERRFRQFTPDQSPEHVLPNTTFHFVTKEQPIAIDTQRSALNSKDTKHTNSLESRQKLKDTSTAEWHMRRKSYGFEKMSPPADKSIFRMDTSTDSGLGRSGELGHWSPTETMPLVRSTVGHFSELGSADNNNNVQKRYRQIRPPKDVQDEELKRHSIAVDESEYMRDNLRKTSQVNLNGFTYDIVNDTGAKSLQTVRSDTFEAVHTSLSSSSASLLQRSQQKRVEFCKTEVHFAAESGRINIVETDGKPPPTNNFRRRRRTTSSALATNVGAVNAIANVSNNNGNINSNTLGLPMTHFGDDQRRKSNITNTVSYRGTLVDPIPDVLEPTNVTISNPNHFEIFNLTESSRNSYASTSGIDTTDGENDEISNIRGILKNKPVKPKPYIFSNLDDIIDSTDGEGGGPFGVHLKPISNTIMPTATVRNSLSNVASTTVAERVRLAEKRQDPILPAVPAYNNYSTKINLSLGDSPDDWNETELPKSNVMNIELHSPQDGLEAKTADVLKTKKTTPIAKPRTTQSERQIKNSYPINSTKVHIPIPSQKKTEPIKEPLKIIKETRGARKLREHELSYFGVQSEKVNANNIHITKVQTTTPTVANNSKRTLQHKKLDDHKFDYPTALNEQKHPTKWHLLNDKPDLLRHSPIVVEPQLITRTAEIYPNFRNQKNTQKVTKPISTPKSTSPVLIDQEIEHFYENTTNELTPVFKVKQLNPTSSYDRKTDLKRDAMILNEMTKNADQTMKALSDEAAIKDERRRSVQRRHTKPLETIDEKTITEKLNDKCIVVKVSRSTLSSEAKRISSRHSTPSPTTRVRTSSQSSTESGPRSGSISSDMEYDSRTKGKHSSSTIHKKTTKIVSNSRSNSLDSQRSVQNSSAEELSHGRGHVSSKSKRHSHGTHTKEKHSTESTEHKKEDHHHQQLSRSYGDRQRSGNSTHSTRRERSNCKDMKCQHHHLQTLLHSAHASSHNERKRRDEHSSESRHDRHEHERIGSGVTRPTPIGQQTKPERGEKEKLTRSRELLLLAFLIMGATQPIDLLRSLEQSREQ
ncbi:uncharacterized protein LOC119662350 isoform X7 [Teleopsis dalmanni]|uniref:uncharacterized protein LOC119662350 isoform X7 n=1 Tax=Teleopsis dalmanni TaxID=139649 RepID=UPI0018CF9731|nr:uncharacterized protein LOC119662350 isoform X7 [Teleopsis dalmanni]